MPSTAVPHGPIGLDDPRRQRLAELVVHLTGCAPSDALAMVGDTHLPGEDDLARVARAIVALRG